MNRPVPSVEVEASGAVIMFRIAGGYLDAVRSIQPSEDVFHRTGFEGRFGR